MRRKMVAMEIGMKRWSRRNVDSVGWYELGMMM